MNIFLNLNYSEKEIKFLEKCTFNFETEKLLPKFDKTKLSDFIYIKTSINKTTMILYKEKINDYKKFVLSS